MLKNVPGYSIILVVSTVQNYPLFDTITIASTDKVAQCSTNTKNTLNHLNYLRKFEFDLLNDLRDARLKTPQFRRIVELLTLKRAS